MESIVGCPYGISYNQWLEEYQDQIFEDTSCYELGPDGEFIYEDHFEPLYHDEDKAYDVPEAEETYSVAGFAECFSSNVKVNEPTQPDIPLERAQGCSCEICGAVGHATAGCPILTDPKFDWWNEATVEEICYRESPHQQDTVQFIEPQSPVPESQGPPEDNPLEYNVADKSGMFPGRFVADEEKLFDQNLTLPPKELPSSSKDLEAYRNLIVSAVLLRICFAGNDGGQCIEDEEEQEEAPVILPEDLPTTVLGNPSFKEEYQEEEASTNHHPELEAIEPPRTEVERPAFKPSKASMHGLKGFHFDTG